MSHAPPKAPRQPLPDGIRISTALHFESFSEAWRRQPPTLSARLKPQLGNGLALLSPFLSFVLSSFLSSFRSFFRSNGQHRGPHYIAHCATLFVALHAALHADNLIASERVLLGGMPRPAERADPRYARSHMRK